VKPARPRKIAIVAPSLDVLGGQSTQAAALADGLRREGFDVAFIPIDPRLPRALVHVRRVPVVRTALNQARYVPSLARLRHADVVHVFSASYWSFLLAPVPAMLAARAFGRRVVLHYHSGEAEDHLSRWGALVHPWLRLADEIVVPSEYLRSVFERYGHRVRVVPNVVDTKRLRYRERVPLRPRLLSIRNLERPYRVDDVLRAFALVRDRRPEATLTVAGSGGEERPLRRLARELGPERMRFVGQVRPEGIRDLYEAADVFLNASVVDNQPVSILEAFASGLPVVSTATGDIATMARHGQAALLVPARDPVAMAAAVLRLLDDPCLARDMAWRARQEARRHEWGRVRREWSAVYEGVA
jgi:glycosyltransferase involved in cell wall biosynthesis